MSALEQKAAALYNEQKYPQALDIYLTLYKKSPKTEKYSIFCGNCLDALGDFEQAVRFYKKATRLNPVSETSLIALANLYYNRQDFANAEKFSLKLLEKRPDNVSALLNMGNISYCRGEFEEALSYYEKVYDNNKLSYIAVINMANTCFDLGRYVKALDFAAKALELYPSSVDAYIIRGNSYLELSKIEKAEESLLKALDFCDNNPWIYNSLSRLYQKAENWDKALDMGWKSVVFAGEAQEDQHINFGYLLYECVDEKESDLAQAYAQKWVDEYPDNPVVKYMARAILKDKKVKKADTVYIQKIFDAFAVDFDETLAGLEYQVPEMIAKSVQKNFKKEFFKSVSYLDIGCGTGLCGAAIKPLLGWSRLTGVDLSEKMLEKAKEKNVYDRLVVDEIINFLVQNTQMYHLVTAGDVLTYFGDLRKVFDGVSRVLAPEGLFVFTVTENHVCDDDYYLMPSGRFIHTLDYVFKIMTKYGFENLSAVRTPLRNEGDRVVYGYVIAAQKIFHVESA